MLYMSGYRPEVSLAIWLFIRLNKMRQYAVNIGSCYLTPATPSMPASLIKGAYTRWGVLQHRSGFGPDLALVILALVLVVWCVVTVL